MEALSVPLTPRLSFQRTQSATGAAVGLYQVLQNAVMYKNPKLAPQELVSPQGGTLEGEQRVAAAGQRALAGAPTPWMLLVSAPILLPLPACGGAIPDLTLGSSHSCFVSEGINYSPGRPGRSCCFAAESTGWSEILRKKIKKEKKNKKG